MLQRLKDRIWERFHVGARLEFEPRDLWVGVYIGPSWWENPGPERYHEVFICLIPTLALNIHWATDPNGWRTRVRESVEHEGTGWGGQ